MTYSGSAAAVLDVVAGVIEDAPRAAIVSRSEDRIDAVFASRIVRFKDDVIIAVDDAAKELHFRSASHLGYSDLGVNRKRMVSLLDQIQHRLRD